MSAFSIMNVVTGKYLPDPNDPTKTLKGSRTFIHNVYSAVCGTQSAPQFLVTYISDILQKDPESAHYTMVELK